MAVHSRRSTEQLFMLRKWSNEGSDQPDQSHERTIFWSEQPYRNCSVIKGSVPVVYYLSINGQLDHPHFIQVPLSSSHGLFLKDVVNKLNFIRGNGMAYMYSWSSKRSYKNGYVWQDLADDDLIQPTNDHDYILKGSEILQPSTTLRSLPKTNTVEAYDPSNHRSSKSRKKNQSWSTFETPVNPSKNNGIYYECRLVKKCESSRELGGGRASADMATQTEAVDRRRSKSMREEKEVYVNKSVESSRDELSDLSPPSMTSSEGLDGVSGSGDVDHCPGAMDPTVQNEYTSGSRIKPSRALMHLINCGSTAKNRSPIKESTRGNLMKVRCGRTVLRDVVDR